MCFGFSKYHAWQKNNPLTMNAAYLESEDIRLNRFLWMYSGLNVIVFFRLPKIAFSG
jgi:hypothetical protein